VETNVQLHLGDIASRKLIVAREDDVMFNIIDRTWKERTAIVVVVRAPGLPRIGDVVDTIIKEHVADSVASTA
jgi:CIC family chloride channel protein